MHVLILGATGRTGSQLLNALLEKNHTITALVRNTEALTSTLSPQQAPHVTTLLGSPSNLADIRTAIISSPTPPKAILVALASPRKSNSPFSAPIGPPDFMQQAHKNLLLAMAEFKITKLVTLSAFGTGSSNSNVFLPMRVILNHANISIGFKDHKKVEEVVRSDETVEGLEWTLVRAVMLSDGEEREVRIFGEEGKGVGSLPSISRKSVASFLVMCLESAEWNGKTPVIAE